MKQKPSVVILEDEEVLLDILQQKLTSVGFDVHTAMDGEAGLALIQKIRPRIVLMDLAMPKRTGLEVLQSMQQDAELKTIPVLIISNSGEHLEVKELLDMGACDYLVKADFTPDEVLLKVEKCLKAHPVDLSLKSRVSTATALGSESEQPTPASPEAKDQGALILIVEDDPFLGEIASKKLSKEGFRVELIDRGGLALEAIKRLRPDLVLLDVLLPDMDGFQVAEEFKRRSRALFDQTPVIFLSNFGAEDHRDRALSLGARDYLVKANFTTDEIIERIKEELKKS